MSKSKRRRIRIWPSGINSNDPKFLPFRRVIERVADDMGILPEDVAAIVARTFHVIKEEVAGGTLIRIPSFGMFGLWYSRRKRTVPVFEAAQGFHENARGTNDDHNAEIRAYRRQSRYRTGNTRPRDKAMIRFSELADKKARLDGRDSWLVRRREQIQENPQSPPPAFD